MNSIMSDSQKEEEKSSCCDRGWEGEASGGNLGCDVLRPGPSDLGGNIEAAMASGARAVQQKDLLGQD